MRVPPADDNDNELERLLRAARHDHDPSAADRAAVERALLRRLGSETASTTVAASTRNSWPVSVQIWFVVAAIALVGVAAWFQQRPARESIQPPSPVQALPKPTAPVAPAHLDDVTRLELPDAVEAPSTTHSKRRALASRRRPSSAIVVADKTSPGQDLAPSQRSAVQPSAAPVRSSIASYEQQQSGPEQVPQAALIAPKPEAQVISSTEREPQTGELAFMRRVHGALAQADFRQVLELAAEHARRWPHGAFEQEREGVRALASCALHLPDSEQTARAYFTRFAQSPLTPRVRATCKLPKREASTSRSD